MYCGWEYPSYQTLPNTVWERHFRMLRIDRPGADAVTQRNEAEAVLRRRSPGLESGVLSPASRSSIVRSLVT